jgi:hypothetical protein
MSELTEADLTIAHMALDAYRRKGREIINQARRTP